MFLAGFFEVEHEQTLSSKICRTWTTSRNASRHSDFQQAHKFQLGKIEKAHYMLASKGFIDINCVFATLSLWKSNTVRPEHKNLFPSRLVVSAIY